RSALLEPELVLLAHLRLEHHRAVRRGRGDLHRHGRAGAWIDVSGQREGLAGQPARLVRGSAGGGREVEVEVDLVEPGRSPCGAADVVDGDLDVLALPGRPA